MQRYHALDSLRASMMLLGVWLHTVVGYSSVGGWPYKDPHPTATFDWTLALIHTFRMPVFMVMAGFFGALLWVRRGERAFVQNRLRRILLPFILGWLALCLPSLALSAYASIRTIRGTLSFFSSGAFLQHLHPMHLWFLEYLLVLYALAFVGVKALERLPRPWLTTANRLFRRALGRAWGPCLFAIPGFLSMLLMRGGYLEDPPGFMPVPRIVLAYALLLAFGWVLYLNRDLLALLERWAWTRLSLAGLLFGAYLVLEPHLGGLGIPPRTVTAGLGAIAVWLIIFGMTGLFLRHASSERPLWRYLSDGSYWIYLAHMPVVMVFQMLLEGIAIPTDFKVLLVVALSSAVLVASYDVLVRSTWVGLLLNGRRYPRWLPSRGQSSLTQPAPLAIAAGAKEP